MLSTLTICRALPPRCFTMASLRVQIRQKAASCRSGRSASISACSPRLNTAFASERQLSRGRITSISQPTSPSSLSNRAIVSPLWLRLNHSGVPAEKPVYPVRHTPSPVAARAHGKAARARPASLPGERPAAPERLTRRAIDLRLMLTLFPERSGTYQDQRCL